MQRRSIGKKMLCALAFAAVAAALCAGVDFLLADDVHSYSRIMMQELYAGAGSIDTLFIGSSHCYRSFDPAFVDEQLGTHSFNAGTSQQLADGSYWLLREASAENDLKTVYLETFFTGYRQQDSRDIPLATFLITDYMRPTSPNRYRYLWEMGGLAALPDLILPARHIIASPDELPALWRAKLTDGYAPGNYAYVTYPDEAYAGRGYVYVTGQTDVGWFGDLGAIDPQQPLTDFGRMYVERIIDWCAQCGIRLVLVEAPLPGASAAATPDYDAYAAAWRAYAAEYGLEYWNFTLYRDAGALPLGPEHFADAHHLNREGAQLFDRVFVQVAAQSNVGQDVSALFYDTIEEKTAHSPDGTVPAAGAAG